MKNRGFLFIFFGAITECGWVFGLKYAATPIHYIITIIATMISTYALITSFRFLPVSLAYILYVGLGTFFIVVSEICITGRVEILRIIFIFTLLAGVFGLKRSGV